MMLNDGEVKPKKLGRPKKVGKVRGLLYGNGTAPKRDGYAVTPAKLDAYLRNLAKTGRKIASCEAAGMAMSRLNYYRTMHKDLPEQEALALAAHVELMESEADRRAMEGVDEPVFYLGQLCGTKRKYSDSLLVERLRAEAPEKYRQRIQQDGTQSVTVQVQQFGSEEATTIAGGDQGQAKPGEDGDEEK